MIRTLRDAGVPLPEVSAVVSEDMDNDDVDAAQLLERHRVAVLEQREQEDLAFRGAASVLRELHAPADVTERSMPAQHYVGQVITVPEDSAEAVTDDEVNDVFGVLYERLQAAGFSPSGPFWTALRAGDRGTIDLVGCWPTTSEVPGEARGPETFAAVLPARTELVVRWRPEGAGDKLPEGALHPAVVGLFDAVAERGIETSNDVEVRQTMLGQIADDFAIELSITVA